MHYHHLTLLLAVLLQVVVLLGASDPFNHSVGEIAMITAETTYKGGSATDGAGTQDVEMQVQVSGEGPPIVLVGGGLTGWRSWEEHANRLSTTRTVARLQLLNVEYGLEDRPLPEEYSVRLESAALERALDRLDWHQPLDLVAWSYGALVTLDFALNNPERVRSLALIEPPALWVLPDQGGEDPFVEALRSLEIAEDVSEADLERFLDVVGLIPPGQSPTEMPQWPVWMEHRRSLRTAVHPTEHNDDRQRLRAFDRPVLLVTGEGTAPFLRRVHVALAALLPGAQTIELPVGHAPHIVSMNRFLSELARFHRAAGITAHQASSKDGTVIGYQARGSGPALLFIHGTTADRRSWDVLSDYLEEDFTVYAMDRRGRGGSGDAPDYDLEREVEDVIAVIEAIGEPVILFGHSFGGLVGLEAALRSNNVSRLVLYEPAVPTGQHTFSQDGVVQRIRALVDQGKLEMGMEVFLREVAHLSEGELAAYRQTPVYESRIPLIRTVPREMAIDATYAFDSQRFSALEVSTLLLLGEESPEIYRRGVEVVHSALQKSEVVILPGEQHVAHLMNPQLIARQLVHLLVE